MVNEIPKWLKGHLTEKDLVRIEEAVHAAEIQTSGEIVPMIVHRSSAVGHVRWILWIALAVLFMGIESLIEAYLGSWGVEFVWVTIAGIVISYPLSALLSGWDLLQRVLTPDFDEVAQVNARAELEFYRQNLHSTSGRTGILLFVSWMERRAVVLVDEGISQHFSKETWSEVVEILLNGARAHQWADGFEKAIQKSGAILAQRLPASSSSRNELRNHLIIR